MTKIYKFKIFIFFALGVWLIPNTVFAASLYFNSPKKDFTVGEQFTASVLVDSVSEPVNAFEGRLIFAPEQLEVKEIFTGNSVINFWIEVPQVDTDGVRFSGIVPGGFQGDKGLLFSVVFAVKAPGPAVVKFSDYKLLLNDGQGTLATATAADLKITVAPLPPGTSAPTYLPFPDGTLPEPFTPELTRSVEEFDNQWFLVFAAQDKGSGIDYYEVCEGAQDNCERAQSPYILRDQNLSGKIFVKAVDKRGNGRLVVLEPPSGQMWYEKYQIYVIILLVLVASLFYALKKYGSRRV